MKNTLYATFISLLYLATSASLLEAANPPKQVLEDGQDPSGLSAFVDLSRAQISLPPLPPQNQAEKELAAKEKNKQKKTKKVDATQRQQKQEKQALSASLAPMPQTTKENHPIPTINLSDLKNKKEIGEFVIKTQQEEKSAGKKITPAPDLLIRWFLKKGFPLEQLKQLRPTNQVPAPSQKPKSKTPLATQSSLTLQPSEQSESTPSPTNQASNNFYLQTLKKIQQTDNLLDVPRDFIDKHFRQPDFAHPKTKKRLQTFQEQNIFLSPQEAEKAWYLREWVPKKNKKIRYLFEKEQQKKLAQEQRSLQKSTPISKPIVPPSTSSATASSAFDPFAASKKAALKDKARWSAEKADAALALKDNPTDKVCIAKFLKLVGHPLFGPDNQHRELVEELTKKHSSHKPWNPERVKQHSAADANEKRPHEKPGRGKNNAGKKGGGNQSSSKSTQKQVRAAMIQKTAAKKAKPQSLPSETPMTQKERNLWSRDVEQLAPPAPSALIPEPKTPSEDEAKEAAELGAPENPLVSGSYIIPYGDDNFLEIDDHANKHVPDFDPKDILDPIHIWSNRCFVHKGITYFPIDLTPEERKEGVARAIADGIPSEENGDTVIIGSFQRKSGHRIYIKAIEKERDFNKGRARVRTYLPISEKAFKKREKKAKQQKQPQHLNRGQFLRALQAQTPTPHDYDEPKYQIFGAPTPEGQKIAIEQYLRAHTLLPHPSNTQRQQEPQRWLRSSSPPRSPSPSPKRLLTPPLTPPLSPPMPLRSCEESVWQDPLPAQEEGFQPWKWGVGPQSNLPPDNWTLDSWTSDNGHNNRELTTRKKR